MAKLTSARWLPEAREDLADAYEYYEELRPQLGDELLADMNRTLAAICHKPRLGVVSDLGTVAVN